MQIVFLYLLTYYFVNRKDANDIVINFLRKFGLKISLTLAFFGAILTLVYSEVVGYPACYLCWIQRGFIYPQIIFLAVAVWMKKKWAVITSLIFSIAGMIVAIYHNWVSLIGDSEKCTAFGNTTSCATRYVYEFGYITIPVMSLTIFLLLTFLLSISLRSRDTISQ